MRRSTFLKLAVLMPVVYATWALTSGLMAQQIKPAREVVVGDDQASASQPRGVVSSHAPVHMTYEYKLKSFDVQAVGGLVSVSSSADMLDTKGDRSYLWRLQSFRAGVEEPVVDIPYIRQIFSIDPAKKMFTPEFSDSIELPQGTHVVVLSLYGVPRGYDTKQLDDPATAKDATLLQLVRTVEIQ